MLQDCDCGAYSLCLSPSLPAGASNDRGLLQHSRLVDSLEVLLQPPGGASFYIFGDSAYDNVNSMTVFGPADLPDAASRAAASASRVSEEHVFGAEKSKRARKDKESARQCVCVCERVETNLCTRFVFVHQIQARHDHGPEPRCGFDIDFNPPVQLPELRPSWTGLPAFPS